MNALEAVRAARLTDLEAKLKAREGKPGMAANVAAIKSQIADLKANATYRDPATGLFVGVEFALQNPESTEVVE